MKGTLDIRDSTLEAVRQDCSGAQSSPARKLSGRADFDSIFSSFFLKMAE
jgi:hypothetical protein